MDVEDGNLRTVAVQVSRVGVPLCDLLFCTELLTSCSKQLLFVEETAAMGVRVHIPIDTTSQPSTGAVETKVPTSFLF